MNFQLVFEEFNALSNGTDAFKWLKNNCEQAIKKSDLLAEHCCLFLIYGFAKNYVLLYEDQPVSPEFSNAAKTQLLKYMQQMLIALNSQDSQQVLHTLNNISSKYMQSSRVF